MDAKKQPESEITKFEAKFLAQKTKKRHKLLKQAKGGDMRALGIVLVLGVL